jgi:hypothetical protein
MLQFIGQGPAINVKYFVMSRVARFLRFCLIGRFAVLIAVGGPVL